jgi:6-phosphogluconolactonase
MKRNLSAILLFSVMIAAGPNLSRAAGPAAPGSGSVYLMTNQPSNAIMIFNRSADGLLTAAGMVATGGAGAQAPGGGPFDPLASEGSLLLSPDRHFLFAVNAGSNEISVLGVDPGGLTLLDKVSSGGQTPISLTINRDLLYVLNAGGTPNITGFQVSRVGKLWPLAGSTRPLAGGAAAGPAEVGFSPNGDLLVVTEKGTNTIDIYRVDHNGLATGPVAQPSNGLTPFGFAFAQPNILIDAEAFGGAPMQAAVSSYRLPASGDLRVLSGSVPDHQTAACWIVVYGTGQYAYTTNTGTHVISGYSMSADGRLTLLNPAGVNADTGPGSNPIDMALTGSLLYVHLNGPNGRSIAGYRIASDGGLIPVTKVDGLPAGAQGIAAH